MGCGNSKDEKKPQDNKSAKEDKPKDQKAKEQKAEAQKPQEQAAAPSAQEASAPEAADVVPEEYPVEEASAQARALPDGESADQLHPDASGVPAGATMETMDATPGQSTVQDRNSALRAQPSGAAAGATMETMDATPGQSTVQPRAAGAATPTHASADGVPTVSVVKHRPARPSRTTDRAAPASPAVASRAAPAPVSAGKPIGNFEDYSPRQAPAVTQQPVVDEQGNPVLDAEGNPVMTEVPAPAASVDVGGGQLIERKEPVWTVARPPPATQGWTLLRQVRVVMQMRKLTAI